MYVSPWPKSRCTWIAKSAGDQSTLTANADGVSKTGILLANRPGNTIFFRSLVSLVSVDAAEREDRVE